MQRQQNGPPCNPPNNQRVRMRPLLNSPRFCSSATGGILPLAAAIAWALACLAALIGGSANAACIAPPAGLVSWWPGDDTAYDLAGFNHAVLRDGASFATGKVG